MRLPGWIEREERKPVSFGASIVLPDGRSVAVMIRDVSANGCCVECDEVLPVAQTVRLDLGEDSVGTSFFEQTSDTENFTIWDVSPRAIQTVRVASTSSITVLQFTRVDS